VTTLLLASASPARLSTLRSAGIDPHVLVSGVDEDAVLEAATARFGDLAPADAVLVLAQAKAQAVADRLADDDTTTGRHDDAVAALPDDVVVLGCDSLLELDGAAFGKPRDAAEAAARWRTMRGRSGVLHTGHWLIDTRPDGTGTLGATASTTVHFAELSDEEIDAYVATGEPLAVAGAFTVDGIGGPFVTGIDGDYHSVVGVSLPLLRELLASLDVQITDLWRHQASGTDPDCRI